MTRSTQAQKAERLNAAYQMLHQQGFSIAEAVQSLSRQFGLSQRQSYRYVQQARIMQQPAPVKEASVAITLKIPQSVAAALRAHSRARGMTIGEIVTRAVSQFLSSEREHG